MADATPIRFLKDDFQASPDARDLALKVFSGTVYEAFTAKTVFFDNTGNIMATKVLTGGHEAQWPIMGKDPSASYHTPGAELIGAADAIRMAEKVVRVDDILVAYVDVPFNDLNISHFDVLGPFATKLGRALATDMDKKLAIVGVRAAREAADTGAHIHDGGQVVTRDDGVTSTDDASVASAYPNNSTGSGNFRDDVAELAQKFDEDNVPEDGRYLFVSPYIRTILRHEGSSWGSTASGTVYGPAGNIYDRDLTSAPGDLNKRIIGMLEGFNVILTNNLPAGTIANSGNPDTKYDLVATGRDDAGKGDADTGYDQDEAKANAKPAALALCGASEGSAAIGMVQAAGLRSVIQDDERRNTKFLKSQMMVGADVLCPWTAGYVCVFT